MRLTLLGENEPRRPTELRRESGSIMLGTSGERIPPTPPRGGSAGERGEERCSSALFACSSRYLSASVHTPYDASRIMSTR